MEPEGNGIDLNKFATIFGKIFLIKQRLLKEAVSFKL